MIQKELLDGEVSDHIGAIRKGLSITRGPESFLTKEDFSSVAELGGISLAMKAGMIKPRIAKLGKCVAEIHSGTSLGEKAAQFPMLSGFIMAITGTGDSNEMLNEVFSAPDPHDKLLFIIKDKFPEFEGALNMLETVLKQFTPTK